MTIGAAIEPTRRRQSRPRAAVPVFTMRLERAVLRLGPKKATAALVGSAVVFGELVHLAIQLVAQPLFTRPVLLCTLLVTLVVSTPMVYYSQILILRLMQSRRDLRALTTRLAVALDEAQAANEAKSRFFANANHELRTPLNAILGFSEMLSTERLGPIGKPRYVEYASDIHHSAQHLLSLVNDLLDLARAEIGDRQVADNDECDVRQIIDDALRMLSPAADRERITLECRIEPRIFGLRANERMVKQMLLNLLSNAIKFAPGGAVLLTAAIEHDGALDIAVADTGIGMSAGDVAVALMPFGQVNNMITRKHSGTGLGLPLAKAMMEMHGGELCVDSALARGTTVALRFPAARVLVRTPVAA
jgi:signal transduction histidine kinase